MRRSQDGASPKVGTRVTDEPYCRDCGYPLKGLVDSSKCPECGKPIVEVLVRDSFPGRRGYRYQSQRMLWGMPLICIASGPHGGEDVGRPVGVIAIGDLPRGIIAIGGRSLGVVSVGGFAMGGIAIGGFSAGLVALGGFTAGIVALGGFALGLLAVGGFALAGIRGFGGQVIYWLR
jgi:hypothetical protein